MSTSVSGSRRSQESDSSSLISVIVSNTESSSSSQPGHSMDGGDQGTAQRARVATAVTAAKDFADQAKSPVPKRSRTRQEDLLAGYFAGEPRAALEQFVIAQGLNPDAGTEVADAAKVQQMESARAQEIAAEMIDLIVLACQLPDAAPKPALGGDAASAAQGQPAPGALHAAPTFGTFSGARPGTAPGRLAGAGGFSSFVHALPQPAQIGPARLPEFTEVEKAMLKRMQEDINKAKAQLASPTRWAQLRAQLVTSWIAAYGGFAFITFAAKLGALATWSESYHLVNFGGLVIGNWGELRAARYRAMNPGYPGLDMAAYQGRDTLRDREKLLRCELEGARGNNPQRAAAIEEELGRLQLDVQKICVDCLRREHGHALKWKKAGENHDVPGPFKSALVVYRNQDEGVFTLYRSKRDRTDQLFVIQAGSNPQSVKVQWNDGTVTDLCKDAAVGEHREAMDSLEQALIHMARWRSFWEDELPLNSLNVHYLFTGAFSPVIQQTLPGPLGRFVDLVFATYMTVQATAGVFLWQNVMRWAIGGNDPLRGTSAKVLEAMNEKADFELRTHRLRMKVVGDVSLKVDENVRFLRGQMDNSSKRRTALEESLADHELLAARLRDLKKLCVKKERQLVLALKLVSRQRDAIRAGWAASLKDHWVKQPLTGISRAAAYWFAFGFYAEVFVPRILLPLRPATRGPAPGNATNSTNATLADAPAAGAIDSSPAGANATSAAHPAPPGFDYAAWRPYMGVGSLYGFVIGGLFSFRNNILVPAIRGPLSAAVGSFYAENHRREANPDLDQQRFYRLVGALSRLKCCGGTEDEYAGDEDANPLDDTLYAAQASTAETSSDLRVGDSGGSSGDDDTTVTHVASPKHGRAALTTVTRVPGSARNLDGAEEDDEERVRLPLHGHDNDDSHGNDSDETRGS
jgi:hypothetical protein